MDVDKRGRTRFVNLFLIMSCSEIISILYTKATESHEVLYFMALLLFLKHGNCKANDTV